MGQIVALCTCGGDADGVCGARGFVFVWNCMHLWALSICLRLFDCTYNDDNYGIVCVYMQYTYVNVAVVYVTTHFMHF